MADNGNTGDGGQAQEAGTGAQGQPQEGASQQGQQSNGQQTTQGQESGQGQGGQGKDDAPDFASMTEEELRTYAAKVHKDAGLARREAANYRTQFQAVNQKVTEAERAQMSELERIQADLQERDGTVQTLTEERDGLKAQVDDLTRGNAVREALQQAGALNPATAFKVGSWDDVKLKEDGTLDGESFTAQLQALRTSDPYLFRRGASADAGAGTGDGSPEAGASINDFVRGGRGR